VSESTREGALTCESVRDLLRCPACKGPLDRAEDALVCGRATCAKRFPVVNGVPVLINDDASVFSVADFVAMRDTTFRLRENRLKAALARWMPDISRNVKALENYDHLVRLALERSPRPRILVLGASILGVGTGRLLSEPGLELVETDVSFGPRTRLVCDAHDIPFADGSFDAVVAQAVMEHVIDPHRCVDEIHRVLKPGGLVYAETPFMQQVHMGRYDFTRFSDLGHRRLFRRFEEISRGAVGGPGMALAWSYQYFLWSFGTSRAWHAFVRGFAAFTAFFLKYFDRYLIEKPGTLDAASGYFFLGRRSEHTLADRELIRLYRGNM